MPSFEEIQEQIISILENEDIDQVEKYLNYNHTDDRKKRREAVVVVYSMLDGGMEYDAEHGEKNSRFLEEKAPVFWALENIIQELWKELNTEQDEAELSTPDAQYLDPIYDDDDD